MTTTTAVTGPILHVYACSCCLACSNDPEMIFQAGGEPVTCKTCGHPCNCPGCLAEDE